MNRKEFMEQLQNLLWDISPAEREEAIRYYDTYFDDAGPENEGDVIASLGSPEKVAENIKKDILRENPATDAEVTAEDRAVVKYGEEPKESNRFQQSVNQGVDTASDAAGNNLNQKAYEETTANREKSVKNSTMPTWAVVLLTVLAVVTVPIWIPLCIGIFVVLFGVLFGGLVACLGIVLGFAITSVVLLGVLIFLTVLGIILIFTDPLIGLGVIGGGFLCGALGVVFLMITVAITGIIIPALCKGICWLFRPKKRKGDK